MYRQLLGLSLVGTLALTGCSTPPPPSSDPQELPTSAPTVAESPVVTPEPVSTPGAFDATPLATQTGEITDSDGFQAAFTVEWLPATEMAASEVPQSCLPALTTAGYQREWTDQDVTIAAIPVRITVAYPVVNGFQWPESSIVSGDLDYVDPARRYEDSNFTTNCTDGVDSFDIKLPGPAEGGGSVETYALFYEPRTPNNPDGARDVNASWLLFETKDQYDWTCTSQDAPRCVFNHP